MLIIIILNLYYLLVSLVLMIDSFQNALIIAIFIDNVYFLGLLGVYRTVLVLENYFLFVNLWSLSCLLLKI
jgi:hypothetical protein